MHRVAVINLSKALVLNAASTAPKRVVNCRGASKVGGSGRLLETEKNQRAIRRLKKSSATGL